LIEARTSSKRNWVNGRISIHYDRTPHDFWPKRRSLYPQKVYT
jgi:hypothetical protein